MEKTSNCEEHATSSKPTPNTGKRSSDKKRLSKKNSDVSCKSKRSVKRKLKTFSFGRWQRRVTKEKVKNFSLSRETCQSSVSIVSETSVESVTCICTAYRRTKVAAPERNKVAEEKHTISSELPQHEDPSSNPGPSCASAVCHEGVDNNEQKVIANVLPVNVSQPTIDFDEISMDHLTLALTSRLGFSTIHLSQNPFLRRYSEINLPYHSVALGNQIYATSAHTQVDYVHHLVPALREILNCNFYWGKMDRYKAEKQLENKPEGTFLLRDSAQEEFLFSVSFRRYGKTLHARVEQLNHNFSFDSHDPSVFSSSTVCGLIEHYKNPRCCMFFEPMLTIPIHRKFPFSLTHLCRAVISDHITYSNVSKLKLPKSIKAFLKEYHYKQKVKVWNLEHDV